MYACSVPSRSNTSFELVSFLRKHSNSIILQNILEYMQYTTLFCTIVTILCYNIGFFHIVRKSASLSRPTWAAASQDASPWRSVSRNPGCKPSQDPTRAL